MILNALFAWGYYGAAIFLLLVAPYAVYEKNKSPTAATLAFFVILVAALQWYGPLRKLIWSSL